MKKIIAFGASNSTTSINKTFAAFAAHQVEGAEVKVLDLNAFETPLYSPEFEKENGLPQSIANLLAEIHSADGLVVSMAEHNSNWSAVFKNLYDWMSRTEKDFFRDRVVFLLATSPGGRGAIGALDLARVGFSRKGAQVVAHFSLPQFGTNFGENGIIDPDLNAAFAKELTKFKEALA